MTDATNGGGGSVGKVVHFVCVCVVCVLVDVPGVRIQAKEKSANKRGGVNKKAHDYLESLVWIAAAAKEKRTKAAPKVRAKTGAGIELKNCMVCVCVCLFN